MKADLMMLGLLLLGGAFSGLLFDFYRMLRREGHWRRMATFAGDLLFSLAVLGILVLVFRKVNYLELRFYPFLASLAGLALYFAVLSSAFRKIFAKLFDALQRLGGILSRWTRACFRSLVYACRAILAIPYGILRWIGLLVFRILEAMAYSARGFMRDRRRDKKS
ncbi:MAG: spore cortex biosynthesis protein YabQ [Peptococcaceae bacterium]|nr:spore cortex biosynthesis protein YabQ [Peptococcaceae bacterium]